MWHQGLPCGTVQTEFIDLISYLYVDHVNQAVCLVQDLYHPIEQDLYHLHQALHWKFFFAFLFFRLFSKLSTDTHYANMEWYGTGLNLHRYNTIHEIATMILS